MRRKSLKKSNNIRRATPLSMTKEVNSALRAVAAYKIYMILALGKFDWLGIVSDTETNLLVVDAIKLKAQVASRLTRAGLVEALEYLKTWGAISYYTMKGNAILVRLNWPRGFRPLAGDPDGRQVIGFSYLLSERGKAEHLDSLNGSLAAARKHEEEAVGGIVWMN